MLSAIDQIPDHSEFGASHGHRQECRLGLADAAGGELAGSEQS
ncbi:MULTISPECIES: hypothetical protein [Rhodococcus]|nr:hypothetical protein [Rhodococcus sp. JS3073]WAM19582.1 hypothetical protein OYT95_38590 [Rhodococcus sp. JS3073]